MTVDVRAMASESVGSDCKQGATATACLLYQPRVLDSEDDSTFINLSGNSQRTSFRALADAPWKSESVYHTFECCGPR